MKNIFTFSFKMILFFIILPFKILITINKMKNFVFNFIKEVFMLWCVIWIFYSFGGFVFLDNVAMNFKMKYYQVKYRTKQKICNYINCEIKTCNESVCVY